jgi:hypothetical protein
LHEGRDVSVYWPLRIGAGLFAGGNNTGGLVYFEALVDLVGLGVRVGHVMLSIELPEFRYAVTDSFGQQSHVLSWHGGATAQYVF